MDKTGSYQTGGDGTIIGAFDILTTDHLEVIRGRRPARIGILSDEAVKRWFGHEPIKPAEQRAEILRHVDGVGEVRIIDAIPRLTVMEAHAALRGSQKSGYGAPAYSRWVNRWAGRWIAAVAFRYGLTPNQVTALSLTLSAAGILMLACVKPTVTSAVLISILLLAGYAFDSADGQLARLRRAGSPAGEWLDHVGDMAKIVALHGAVALSWYRFGTPGHDVGAALLSVPLIFAVVSAVAFFGWLLVDLLGRASGSAKTGPRKTGERKTGAGNASGRTSDPAPDDLRSWLRLPSDYGLLAMSFLLLPESLFAPAYVSLMAVNAVILALALPRWFAQAKQI